MVGNLIKIIAMANPQRENGHIDIANEIAEALMIIHLSGYENRVLWAIFRKTYGWNKTEDWITNSQIAKMTNIAESHISRTIKILIQKKIVTKNGKKLAFQKDYDKWGKLPKMVSKQKLPKMVSEVTKNGIKKLPKMVDTIDNKDTTTKDTIQKKKEFEFLKDKKFSQTFNDYLDMRKNKGKTYIATDKAKELVLIKLHKCDIDTAILMLEKAITGSWTDVWELKPSKPQQQKEHIPEYLTHRLGDKKNDK